MLVSGCVCVAALFVGGLFSPVATSVIDFVIVLLTGPSMYGPEIENYRQNYVECTFDKTLLTGHEKG